MDQLSKKIIKALESSPNYTCMFYVDKEPFSDIAPYPLVSAAIKYLTDNGYLDEIVRNERVIGIKLSHKCFPRTVISDMRFFKSQIIQQECHPFACGFLV